MLAIAVAAATAGAGLIGYSVRAAVRGTATEVRTVTVVATRTETLVRTIVRPDARAGRRVFITVCSRCHTLEPGDWTGGRVNLTDLAPTYRVSVDAVTGGGVTMPALNGKLSEREIRDVAAFVTAETARRRVRASSASR